jgi:hypothetical protein
MAYILDSDVFIQASNMHYQFAFCSAFWDWIERENSAGRLFSIDWVLREIEEGKFGELVPWVKARSHLFLKSADSDTMNSLLRVANWVRENYEEASYEKFFSGADFVLVGYAHAHNHTLVTQETGGGRARIKIPDACAALGVKCVNTWELMKTERPRFILAPPPDQLTSEISDDQKA